MRDNKKITVLILILVLILSATTAVGAQGRINDMNFKNADLTDVLRAIAEVANVNLITDSNVSGTITIHLKDISFNKALNLITQTRSLTYKWDENTVVVASPDRIEEIYSNMVTEFVAVKSNDLDNISVIVKDIFPDTQITADPVRRQFILKGEEKRVVEIKEMIERLDTSAVAQQRSPGDYLTSEDGQSTEREELYTESYQLVNTDLADLTSKLQSVNSNLSIRSNELTNTVTISGREAEVKEALSMAKTYDESLEPETRSIRVDYIDTEQISEIVEKFYPNVNIHVNAKRKEIIINGAKNKLSSVVQLIEEINIPKQQVIIEARVEEITRSGSAQIGVNPDEFSSIKFIKESNATDSETAKIDKVRLTWPDYLDALESEGMSETLANPRLMTLNGEKAEMLIGEEVPIPQGRDDNNNIEYSYEAAGISLEFTPWITSNNEIEIEIIPEVSNFGESLVGGLFPIKRTRRVSTKLRLKDGETLAIGGLIQQDDVKNLDKVPFLGDIPILGEIFKYRDNNDSKTELIIFVTPRIVNYGDVLEEEDHLIDPEVEANKVLEENTKEKNDNDITNDEIINEYLEERSQSREEILSKIIKNKDNKETEFQELTPEELEAIINKN